MKKTKLIVFRPRPIDLAHYISLVMGGNVVEQVESTKFLGVVVVMTRSLIGRLLLTFRHSLMLLLNVAPKVTNDSKSQRFDSSLLIRGDPKLS